MKIKKIEIRVRNPTVQYGYLETNYTVELDEDGGDTIKGVLRYIHAEHAAASIKVNEDDRARKKVLSDKDWDLIPH